MTAQHEEAAVSPIKKMADGIGRAVHDNTRFSLSAEAQEICARAALKALSDAGWKVVPKEPTEEIYEAYDSVPKSECPCVRYYKRESGDMTNEDYQQWVRETCDLDYRAMLAAAPEVT